MLFPRDHFSSSMIVIVSDAAVPGQSYSINQLSIVRGHRDTTPSSPDSQSPHSLRLYSTTPPLHHSPLYQTRRLHTLHGLDTDSYKVLRVRTTATDIITHLTTTKNINLTSSLKIHTKARNFKENTQIKVCRVWGRRRRWVEQVTASTTWLIRGKGHLNPLYFTTKLPNNQSLRSKSGLSHVLISSLAGLWHQCKDVPDGPERERERESWAFSECH